MFGNIVGWLILLSVTILAAWLTWSARRVGNRAAKWAGLVVGGLVTVILLVATGAIGSGLYQFYAPRNKPVPAVQSANTSEQIVRGEHVARFVCAACHSPTGDLPLIGGKDVGKESPVPIGALVASNLTPGGPLAEWSDGEIFRALRHGIDRDGRPLIAMSALATRRLSDEDMLAVIAYLRSQPAVTSAGPEGDRPNLLFALFAGAGLVPVPEPIEGVVTAPPKAASAEYGEYIVSYVGCQDCHGTGFRGGVSGGLTPAGPNLVALVPNWTQDQFIQTIRTGVDPTGHALIEVMPWKAYAHMDDEELSAIQAYIQELADEP